ncbi:MAG: exopolysaccharide biosynthesis polyprenyl glycosylphosphotransferase [Hyphomonas sp.]|nr:exopolysaccharide biosynthesis polyprenyl glycosylphosphotransferase [Hyphomonas sp.]
MAGKSRSLHPDSGRETSLPPADSAQARILPLAIRAGARGLVSLVVIAVACLGLRASASGVLSATIAQALPYAAIAFAILWGLHATRAFDFEISRKFLSLARSAALGAVAPAAVVMFAAGHLCPADEFRMVAITACAATGAAIAAYLPVAGLNRFLARSGRLSENIVIVGATENARRLILRNAESRELNIVGVFDDRLSRAPEDIAGVRVLGRIDDLLHWDRLPDIDRIVVTVTSDARSRVRTLIDKLRILPHRIVLLLDLDGFDPESASLSEIAHSPAAYVSGVPRDTRRALIKRGGDIAFALMMAVVFAPFFLAVALAVKLDSPGPVFFRQKRLGFNNQVIRVWKFRSMRADAAAEERMSEQATACDPRITRVGRFIRRTSLDELPQLLNVLTGEMSIVGPRPHAVGMTTESIEVHDIVGDYAHRHRVKPGITGWAQVNGSRGPVHTKAEVRERIRLDLEYVNRASFWFDLLIMLKTAPCLLGDSTRNR